MIVESYEDVIKLSGELRQNFYATVHTAISLLLKRHPSGVIIDCSEITEITPEGAETFYNVLQFVNEHEHARIVLAGVKPHIWNVMQTIPDVRSQLPVVETVEEARKSIDLFDEQIDVKKKRLFGAKVAQQTILACLNGDEPTDIEIIAVTKELVSSMETNVVVLLPVTVPRDLPLQAPIPEIEDKAIEAADIARQQLDKVHKHYTIRLERTRSIVNLIKEMVDELKPTRIVMAIQPKRGGEAARQSLIDAVFERISEPVVFVKAKTESKEGSTEA